MNEKCFANKRKGKCCLLTTATCLGYRKCPFYKPIWMYERDRERANVKLRALPLMTQAVIADKYFKGDMPWSGGT